MSTKTTIHITGVPPIVRKLTDMLIRGKTFTPLFAKQMAEIKLAWAGNFSSGGFVSGGWMPLDASYAAWKLIRYPGSPPMVRTGRLFQSLSVGITESLFSATPNSYKMGTSVEYAKFHQYGTTKMPARQIVFVPTEFAQRAATDAANWVVRGEI